VFGIAPKLVNATGYWEQYGASVRLSYNWKDGSASSGPGQNGLPIGQLIGAKRFQWDLSASYTLEALPLKPQITLNVLNITDEKLRTNFTYPNAVYEYYNPGRSISLGVRGKF
jgi:outer membrane receptor protein involved in Fe transport